MDITLSSNEFKALASETRTTIIKLLKERNHTLTEIAEKMELTSPTIKQHLEKLENAQLIEQIDSGHKWKYYSLTRKGKTILEGNTQSNSNIFIVIGTTIATLVVLMLFFSSITQLGATGKQTTNSFDSRTLQAPALEKSATGTISNQITATTQTEILPSEQAAGCPTNVYENQSNNTIQLIALIIASAVIGCIVGYFIAKNKK